MKRLIALTGRARSGKNTTANILQEIQGETSEKNTTMQISFAGILKDMAQRSLKISPEEAELLKAAPNAKIANGLGIREFYNSFGDALKSYLGDDLWVKITTDSLQNIMDMIQIELIIITDLRYTIEEEGLREFCKQNDTEFIIIKTKNLNQSQRLDNLDAEEHESEFLTDQINHDYLIEARSVEEIKEQVQEILKARKVENAP